MVSREPTTTFVPNRVPQNSRSLSGFTLIEILIVIGIISMVMALAMPAIEQVTRQRVLSTCRRFIGTIRTVRNDAILLNQVHRIGIDFEKKVWWVDAQRQFQLLETEETLAERAKKRKGQEPPPSTFSLAEKFSKKPIPFPDSVSIDGVLKEKGGFQKEGVVFIYFFPNGYNEPALLYLNRAGLEINESYTLSIQPTSGRVDFFKLYVRDFDAANA
ncbi:MAG: prepilin-type N-terminal cleavage/methylation domain-containing protein [Deltaproteobacteria bacterium]|nr:prepilin-type N-terminal cleavage/methylation domain-containing protein [Deltaproteobacteria bacterium]MBI3293837.1 prepilin-type N-terminal cleavage/methylation domain-containing protein [Deltaproteobacteria bacterium]